MIRLEILPIIAKDEEQEVICLPLPKFNGYTAKIAEIKEASDEALKKV